MSAPTLLIATPSCDVYGSDLQMLETVRAVRDAGWQVVVTAPAGGPLAERLTHLGATVRVVPAPVLRRADASPAGVAALVGRAVRALPAMVRLVRSVAPDVVLVNTITLPLWPAVARLVRRPVVVHVHEAEDKDPRVVRRVMAAPLALAAVVVMNSRTTLESLGGVAPFVRRRSTVVHNGVEPPPTDPGPRARGSRARLVVVGRLTRRKGCDVALEAVAALVRLGYDVELELVGSPAPGGESFVDELRERASRPDLAGRVALTGYATDVWSALERADIVLAPSLGESFGNAVVEAQLACRPVVATGVQGHLETVRDGETGLLVPWGDPRALADATARLLEDEALAQSLARRGRGVALESFTAARYREEMSRLLGTVAGRAHR
ncbi:glycosyltransferase family 4 protein [Nocardioides sediminis]|uniref:glycosyltransferase family 4 protein n=1 Tax=Nocardioides sediminis TaxID=433648 RepID=UPI001F17C381|nr:glycosyltransferase family 4 protein [Nocardioides sediminis]